MDTTTKINKPLVSILMLTYNRARFIGEAVNSVLNQTFQNWELIIIDDGSTDNTHEIAEGYSDPRIHYIQHKENLGLLARRQESLTYATSTYTAVLDSDDIWLDTDKLTQQVEYLEAHPEAVLIGTFLTRLDEHGNPTGETRYETGDGTIRAKLLSRNQFAHSSVLMRTSALRKIAGYRFPLAEDLDLFLQLGLQGTFANLPLYATGYRVHSNSETSRQLAMVESVLAIIRTHRSAYPWYHMGLVKYSLYQLLLRLRYICGNGALDHI